MYLKYTKSTSKNNLNNFEEQSSVPWDFQIEMVSELVSEWSIVLGLFRLFSHLEHEGLATRGVLWGRGKKMYCSAGAGKASTEISKTSQLTIERVWKAFQLGTYGFNNVLLIHLFGYHDFYLWTVFKTCIISSEKSM